MSLPRYSDLMICLPAAVCVIVFNTAPALLGALANSYQFSNDELGWLASSNFAGYTLATILTGLFMGKLHLHRAALLGTGTVILAFIGLSLSSDFGWIAGLLFVAGAGSGIIYVNAVTTIAEGEHPTQVFALMIFCQMALSGVVVVLISNVIEPVWDIQGVAYSYALLFCLCYLILKYFTSSLIISPAVKEASHKEDYVQLASSSEHERSTKLSTELSTELSDESKGSFSAAPLLALAALLVCYIGVTGVWVFMERIGSIAGFNAGMIGTALMAALIAGALGALASMVMDQKFGLNIPIFLSSVLLSASLLVLIGPGSSSYTIYILCLVVFQFAWSMSTSYLLTTVAVLDKSERHAALLPAAMGIGAVIGPVITGSFSSEGFQGPIYFAVMLIVGFTALHLFTDKIVSLGRVLGSAGAIEKKVRD
ncbi:MAG: MFS transporter [Pseudomonadales bacterium]